MNKYIMPVIASTIIITYSLLFHLLNVSPHNWNLAVMWSLIYILPVWIIFFVCEYINGDEEE